MPRFLGKNAPVFDAAIPQAKTLLMLPPSEKTIDWSKNVPLVPMIGNDICGNCTIATSMHYVQFATACNGAMEMPRTSSAIDNYSRAAGYNPVTKANDVGLVPLDKNKFWMSSGFSINPEGAVDYLDAFAQIEGPDIDTLLSVLQTFGPCELGLELPTSADPQFETGRWDDISGAPGSLGGHDTLLVGVTSDHEWFKIATWDGYVMASQAWLKKYMSEGTALLRRKWINPLLGVSPSGYTMAYLDQMIVAQRGYMGLGAT